jgi:hypothetical protein
MLTNWAVAVDTREQIAKKSQAAYASFTLWLTT